MSSTSQSIAEPLSSTTTERLGRLGGVAIGVPDPAAAADFLREALAFAVAGADQDGSIVVSCVGDYGPSGQAAIELRPADELTLLEVIWEVPPAYDLAGLETRLGDLSVSRREDAVAFIDPAGIHMACVRADGRRQPSPPHDPLRPRRLGHVNLKAADPGAAASFYRDVLGFRLSEQIGDGLYFLRIASEHHNIGLRGGERGELHHLGFEVEGWNVYQPILDRLAELGIAIEYGPGRHRPGNNLFVYVRDPSSGLRLELFADMAHIPDESAHAPRRWEAADRLSKTINQWGPGPPASFLE
jgi:catechol 2,3-dioxygenase-like lactoylglutathione lyase family enzyme